jgi:hypothetical protein
MQGMVEGSKCTLKMSLFIIDDFVPSLWVLTNNNFVILCG